MKLLGQEIKALKEADEHGDSFDVISCWLKDPCYDLWTLSDDPDTIETLKKFQNIASHSGATDIRQAEYFYKIEDRIKKLEVCCNIGMNTENNISIDPVIQDLNTHEYKRLYLKTICELKINESVFIKRKTPVIYRNLRRHLRWHPIYKKISINNFKIMKENGGTRVWKIS